MLGLACLEAAPARAADPRVQQDLEQAEQALVNLDYEGANKAAARVVQQRGLSHEQLVRAYRVLGVTDAVPETIEASLQLSEAVLVDVGVPMGLVIASIHEKRDEYRKALNQPLALGARIRRARDARAPQA